MNIFMCHQEPCHVKVILGPSQEIALTGTVGVFSVLAGKPLNEEVGRRRVRWWGTGEGGREKHFVLGLFLSLARKEPTERAASHSPSGRLFQAISL